MPHTVTTNIYLDVRRAKGGKKESEQLIDEKQAKYPVKLRVTFLRESKFYPAGVDMTQDYFDKVMKSEKPRDKEKQLRLQLNAFEKKATDIIDKLAIFTFQNFERKFLNKRSKLNSVSEAYLSYIDRLKEAGRIGTAVSCETSLNSLICYKSDLRFEDITVEFLNDYESWMLREGKRSKNTTAKPASITTVGIYLRALRSVFRQAIKDREIPEEPYPFKEYIIPTGKNVKKALAKEDVCKIRDYDCEKGSTEEMCRDYWYFLYLSGGINAKDFCRLKYSNIQDGFIEFIRAKSARTKRVYEPIRIPLRESAKAIISKWGNADKSRDNYIFPILAYGITPERERTLIQYLTKTLNKYVKRIASELNLSKPVSVQVARHSYATVLKRSGASTEFISESLGHTNTKTTQSYLGSFDDETKRNWSDALED